MGVGAFNLVRREAFDALGGFGRRPLEMVEDLRLGQDMKAAGFRSVAAFGPGMVQVHWAAGGLGHRARPDEEPSSRRWQSPLPLVLLRGRVGIVGDVLGAGAGLVCAGHAAAALLSSRHWQRSASG